MLPRGTLAQRARETHQPTRGVAGGRAGRPDSHREAPLCRAQNEVSQSCSASVPVSKLCQTQRGGSGGVRWRILTSTNAHPLTRAGSGLLPQYQPQDPDVFWVDGHTNTLGWTHTKCHTHTQCPGASQEDGSFYHSFLLLPKPQKEREFLSG